MTLDEVRNKLEEIQELSWDDERAHALEDQLFVDVLQHFADQGNELAKEALKSLEVVFSRWTA